MPTEELKFEDLLKEYNDVIESIDVDKLKRENELNKVDIQSKDKEVKRIDGTIEQIKEEIETLKNSTVDIAYQGTIKEKEENLKEANAFKEKKSEEISKLKEKTKENNAEIKKFKNIGKEVIKKAEERTNSENEKLQFKIEDLKRSKLRFGLKTKDKDGNDIVQLTAEENKVIESIDREIEDLEREIISNRKSLLMFKQAINERDKALSLKNKKKRTTKKVKKAPKKKESKKEEPKKEEPKKEEPKKEEPKKEEPNKEEPEKEEVKKEEPEKEEVKKEEVKKEEPEKEEVKKEEPKKDDKSKSNDYQKLLEEYKRLLIDYKADSEQLYNLQQSYENEEIDYSEYEKFANYMVERYDKIKSDYEIVLKAYNEEKLKEDKYLTNDDLQNRLKELEEETTELWQQGVHENTPDEKRYHEALEEIKKIKEELKQREENPLRGMTIEELEAKKRELYAKIGEQQEPDEYHFRTHEENGMEGHEDEIDRGLREIREEIERRQSELEAPEKPEQPMMIKGRAEKDPPISNNLPMKSGLQVYDELLDEVGYVKGTKAIKAHDFIDKFNILGLNKIVSWGIRVATGRKKEVKRIESILDDLQEQSPEDFELLLNDFMLEDNDTRNIMKYKVNEIFLVALENKCRKDFEAQEPVLNQCEQELIAQDKELREKLGSAEGEEKEIIEQQLIALGRARDSITARRKQLELRPRRIREGKEDKSYDRKNNIKGGLRANRNPDNRKEIKELANVDRKRTQAIANGDKLAEQLAVSEMSEYESSQTKYKYNRKGKVKISLGAFDAKEGELKIIDHQKNMAPELGGAITTIGITIGASYLSALNHQQQVQAQVDAAIRNAETNVNNHINTANQTMTNTIDGIKNGITTQEIQAGEQSLTADVLKIHSLGERGADLGAGYNFSNNGAYPNLDAMGVARTDNTWNSINGFSASGNNTAGKAADIFLKKGGILADAEKDAFNVLEGTAKSYYSNGTNLISHGGVDHTISAMLEQGASNFGTSNATFYKSVANLLIDISNITPAQIAHIAINNPQVAKNLMPILIVAAPQLANVIKELMDSNKQKRKEPKQNKKENKTEIVRDSKDEGER